MKKLNDSEAVRQRKPGLVEQWIIAKHRKICPPINFVQGDK